MSESGYAKRMSFYDKMIDNIEAELLKLSMDSVQSLNSNGTQINLARRKELEDQRRRMTIERQIAERNHLAVRYGAV